jgi:general secretion pathway protein G
MLPSFRPSSSRLPLAALPGPVRKRSGFTLAELMVVIVIIGLLVAVVAPNVFKYLSKGQVGTVKATISNLENAVDSWALDNSGKYPDSLDVLVQPDESGQAYLKSDKIPLDPWKNEFIYEPPSGQQKMIIRSYGRDGQPGGEGEDRDIDNQMIHNGEI